MRSCVLLAMLIGIGTCCGCGSDADILPGRVAIEVKVSIASSEVGDGNLVLRPEPGVKCPLIKVPVTAGIGRLDASAGPVPGRYKATYLPNGAGGTITEQLTESGRRPPTSAGGASNVSPPVAELIQRPQGTISVTVPDQNPATFVADFEAA